jgi:uncharacterized DUF497 family protein
VLAVRRLVWDPWNVNHIARHDVSPEEVEQVCYGRHVILESYKERLLLIGRAQAGRMLAVILEAVAQDTYYVVTSRPTSRKERAYYEQQIGGEKE